MRKTISIAAMSMIAHAGAAAAKPAADKGNADAPQLGAIASDVPMPQPKSARGSVSPYPFDQLSAVGQSIPVLNKTAAQLSSIVNNQNRKHKVNKTDPVTGVTIYKTTELKDAAGNVTRVPSQEPEKVASKKFQAFDCDPATDPAKATARIFRVL